MKILKGSQGLALFTVMFAMTVLLLFLSARLFLSRIETKITANHKLANQALDTADAGLQHAVAVIETGYDFDGNLACGTLPCTLASNSSFPPASGFSYTVTVENDLYDINNGGTPTDDTNNLVVLNSRAYGPNDAKSDVQAYVGRSVDGFDPPSPLYINASSAISADSAGTIFDDDSLQRIIGNDTDPGDLLNAADDTPGPKPSLRGVATTSSALTDALIADALLPSNTTHNEILGVGNEPSIGTTADLLDVDKIADNFFNHPGAVKYLNGLETDGITCPSTSPCNLGTSAAPQITYIKDSLPTDVTILGGHVIGYGVLVLEGRTMIGKEGVAGDNFRFNGLVIHKRSDSSHYITIEDSAWIYGSVLLGSFSGEAKFRVEDYAHIFYSSQAIAMANSLCGSCLPQPARISAWLDK